MGWLFTVPQGHCVVIERLGKYSRICKQGLHVIVPILDQIRYVPEWGDMGMKEGKYIELTEQCLDTKPRTCHTRDNVAVDVDASVYYRVTNPARALYNVDVLPRQVIDSALNVLRACIGRMELDDVLARRAEISETVASELAQRGNEWGVQFRRVEIQELVTGAATNDAMRQQMEAERRRRAMVAESEGQAAADVNAARGAREAAILRAEGIAQSLQTIAAAEAAYLERLSAHLDRDTAARILLASKVLEGYREISSNPAHKVFIPNNLQAVFNIETSASPKSTRAAEIDH